MITPTLPRSLFILPLVAVLALHTSCVSAQGSDTAPSRTPDVVFVPTPQPVVEAMLQLAKVKRDEIVYDLGCGDGRAVITAARDFGARGIGVDIDPERIQESRENAQSAGVSNRVEFKQADLFEMQFADADVLFLYLLPALNVRLRPRILDELRPGTRVVSHAFTMGEWTADETIEVDGIIVYFWVVPAKVAGDWDVTLADGSKGTLALTQEFQMLDGTLKIDGQTQVLRDARMNGSKMKFAFGTARQSGEATAEFAKGQLSGTLQRAGGQSVNWTAQQRK